MLWICRAFDSRQNRGGNSGAFFTGFMHQSFATTSLQGPGNSGDIDISICKAQVKSPIDPKAYLGRCKTT